MCLIHDFPIPGYHIIPSGYMRLMSKPLPDQNSSVLEGEYMNEYKDEGINDACSITMDTTAHLLAHDRIQTPATDIAGPATAFPVSTRITATTTLADSIVSVQVENTGKEQQPTTVRVEVCSGNSTQVVSVYTTPDPQGPQCRHSSPCVTVNDSLGRPHFKVPHTGPATVCLRSAVFHSSTSEMHTNDMKPVLDALVQEGKTVVTIIADGGPDWSTGSLLNAIYYLRLWKACNLDMLCITSFAARYSAYNPIEHLWAPLSKKLSSVRLSPIAEGDHKAPYYISGLSEEAKKAKEASVFDKAITEMADVHWNHASFDGFPVIPVPVKCVNNLPTSDHETVSKFLKAPLKQARDGSSYKTLLEEYKFMLAHVHRHHNEVIFLKCNECVHCTQHPVQTTQVFSFLRERGMKIFHRLPSAQHVGHYCTFLEMCSKRPDQLPIADTHLPSFEKELGHCSHCPNYVFLSKTEKNRHFQVFHPKKRKPKTKHVTPSKRFQCSFKITPTQVCDERFGNIYLLRKHRKTTSHQRKKKARRPQTIDPDIELYVARVRGAIATGTAREADIEKEGSGVKEGDGEKESDVEGGDEDSEKESDVEGDAEMKEDEDEDEECIMCGLTEEDDEEVEVWIECTKCLRWVHKSCLPPHHSHDADDDHFLCPECNTKKPKRMSKLSFFI